MVVLRPSSLGTARLSKDAIKQGLPKQFSIFDDESTNSILTIQARKYSGPKVRKTEKWLDKSILWVRYKISVLENLSLNQLRYDPLRTWIYCHREGKVAFSKLFRNNCLLNTFLQIFAEFTTTQGLLSLLQPHDLIESQLLRNYTNALPSLQTRSWKTSIYIQ